MEAHGTAASLEQQIDQWRSYIGRRRAIEAADVAELEDHLREQIATLAEAGLTDDEAFLVAARRLGSLDAISREFAREHSDRLWKQLVLPACDANGRSAGADASVAFALAVVSGVVVTIPRLLGLPLNQGVGLYLVPFLILPLLTGYFAWKRRLDAATQIWIASGFVLTAVLVTSLPFVAGGDTSVLAVVHLPVALLPLLGVAYTGGRWSQVSGRMDVVRFLGELCVYFLLATAVGGLLVGSVAGIFRAVGIRVDLEVWLLPACAAAAVFIAAWLVEKKQGVIENLAPVMTRIFTPFFAALLIVLLVSLLWTDLSAGVDRGVLQSFLLLLVVVLAFLLFSVSARDPHAPPGLLDIAHVALAITALLGDAVVLWAIAARIHEFGFTANRTAALGLNLVLLVHLAWSAALYVGFVKRRVRFTRLERWHTDYLTVYAAWATAVVLIFPPLFGYR